MLPILREALVAVLINQTAYFLYGFGVTVLLTAFLMRPKRFYIIRHGESLLNAEHIRQGEEGALSSAGREQAALVGRYLKHLSIQKIISSTYPRAKETAQIINTFVQARIEYSSLLVERRNASEVVGKSTRDPETLRISEQIDLAYHEDNFRFSDEENFIDMRQRAKKCLQYLSKRGVRETVIVTHHVFLKMLIAYLLYRENLHAKDFVRLSFFNYSNNASITIVEYHPWKKWSSTHGWEVVSYNEQVGM